MTVLATRIFSFAIPVCEEPKVGRLVSDGQSRLAGQYHQGKTFKSR